MVIIDKGDMIDIPKNNDVILDSGKRRQFESGAVRDIVEGKGRCDLLPLREISDTLFDDPILRGISCILEGDINLIGQVIELFISRCYGSGTDKKVYAILELSKHYENGCNKYGERNWEKGIPCHCYIDSAVRHYLKLLRGDEDERHDRAFLWNMFGLMWTLKHRPECDDLPHKDEVEDE